MPCIQGAGRHGEPAVRSLGLPHLLGRFRAADAGCQPGSGPVAQSRGDEGSLLSAGEPGGWGGTVSGPPDHAGRAPGDEHEAPGEVPAALPGIRLLELVKVMDTLRLN